MAPQIVHLPDGQTFTVTPIFGGVGFKSHELNTHNHPYPAGWTVVLHTEDEAKAKEEAEETNNNGGDDDDDDGDTRDNMASLASLALRPKPNIRPFTRPTLHSDTLFLSSIANPSSSEFKPAASPTRQIAMMVWVTLYWYFHQPEPEPYLEATDASGVTPLQARPRGEWKVYIKRDGILRGRNLIPKLERMGLIASEDTAVGTRVDDGGDSWAHMFVSKRMFWQIPGRLFLFTLQPNRAMSSFPGSPATSRPGSPGPGDSHGHYRHSHTPSAVSSLRPDNDLPGAPIPTTVVSVPSFPIGPFSSTSHLPTYYPPPPLQYVFTNGFRHPLRPKPPRMGETFYARFVPSVGQFLSFRVASSSPNPVPHVGPVGPKPPENTHLGTLSDTALLQMWLAKPRVQRFWGEYDSEFLNRALSSSHSFPAIGLWDGVPFGYFEIYWVKEDVLGQTLGHEANDWDRGLHMFVGEEWARGRVPSWLSGLVHWCFCLDMRTMSVCLEPRVDNEKFLQGLQINGFVKERMVSFPHKQSWMVRLKRDTWEGPAL